MNMENAVFIGKMKEHLEAGIFFAIVDKAITFWKANIQMVVPLHASEKNLLDVNSVPHT